jgi:hypothetical protein
MRTSARLSAIKRDQMAMGRLELVIAFVLGGLPLVLQAPVFIANWSLTTDLT